MACRGYYKTVSWTFSLHVQCIIFNTCMYPFILCLIWETFILLIWLCPSWVHSCLYNEMTEVLVTVLYFPFHQGCWILIHIMNSLSQDKWISESHKCHNYLRYMTFYKATDPIDMQWYSVWKKSSVFFSWDESQQGFGWCNWNISCESQKENS